MANITKTRGMRIRRKAKQKIHNQTLEKIDHDPKIIADTIGLIRAVFLDKEKGPEMGVSGQETIDNLFLFETDTTYEIVAVEIKAGSHQAGKGMFQLRIAEKFFKKHWTEWLSQKVSKVKLKEVWLTRLLLHAEPLTQIREMVVSRRKEKLGEVKKKQVGQKNTLNQGVTKHDSNES